MGWRRCGAPTRTTTLAEWRLVAVGKIGSGPEAELFARYNDRLRPKLSVIEIAEGRGAAGEIKRREADAILAAVPDNALAIALDLGPAAPDSETFAGRLSAWIETGKPLAFIIGGAEGLERRVIERANHVLSLGPLTWPHMLVRVMLAEQLFRARAIASNHPYHRAGRP
jgi:23S rRNA (pseudouridine1915-N3)-methyltransferase